MPKASIGRVRNAQLSYGNVCTISGCNSPRRSGNRWCSVHKNRSAYRGDPTQGLVPLKDRNFARRTVTFLIKDNETNPAFGDLMTAIGDNWEIALRKVNQELLLSATGFAMNKRRRSGLRIAHAILTRLTLIEVFKNYCGFQFLHEYSPRMFVSDIALRHTMIRSLRSQAGDHASEKIDKLTGKSSSYTSPLYVTERDTAWEILSSIFGATGLKLFQQLNRRAERLIQNGMNINKAIKNIN